MNLEWIWNEFHVLFQFYSNFVEWIFSLPTLFQIHSNLVEWIFSLPTFIPNSFQIYRHEYILCQFLCRFYSKGKMNENGMKMEWNWNEMGMNFMFYSNFIPSKKYSFHIHSNIEESIFLSPLYANFIPILSVLFQIHSKIHGTFYAEGKLSLKGMKME